MLILMDDGRGHPPTRKNIIDAFVRITQYSNAGDVVFIHYSGHGGRVRLDSGNDCDEGDLRRSLWSLSPSASTTQGVSVMRCSAEDFCMQGVWVGLLGSAQNMTEPIRGYRINLDGPPLDSKT